MKINDLKTRVDELINIATEVIASKEFSPGVGTSVPEEGFNTFRSASLSFLRNTFGETHPFYSEFDKRVAQMSPYDVEEGRGILKAAKQEIDGGWIFTVRGLVSAEIFSDFVEMAEHLLKEGYKDPAAVVAGSVLEEHLRQLCTGNAIPTEMERDGRFTPKKADSMNSELAGANVYGKLDQKSVTSWLDLRNKAAHGKYEEYTREQVNLMLQGITNFIARTSH